jgi:hypothetical protein
MSYESHKNYNGNLHASIAKDVNNQQLFMDLHVGLAMDVKNQQLLRNLCAGITYLKWPYGNYNRKDLGIAQCSF